jgi:hypothetical protein
VSSRLTTSRRVPGTAPQAQVACARPASFIFVIPARSFRREGRLLWCRALEYRVDVGNVALPLRPQAAADERDRQPGKSAGFYPHPHRQVRAALGRQHPAIEAGLPAAHVSRQRPGGGPFEANALHHDGITPAALHVVTGSEASRTVGELLQVPERRIPFRLAVLGTRQLVDPRWFKALRWGGIAGLVTMPLIGLGALVLGAVMTAYLVAGPDQAEAGARGARANRPPTTSRPTIVHPWLLDHDLLRRRAGLAVAVRPGLQAEQGADRRDVQPGPGPVQDPVEQGLHLRAGLKQHVPRVLGLVDRVGIAEPAALLLGQVQVETQAGAVDPPVADLAQAPYSRLLRPGIPRRAVSAQT